MPLLDHVRPPINEQIGWSSFHANWATRLADQITALLPEGFRAEESTHPSGSREVDVASYRDPGVDDPLRSTWQPIETERTVPLTFPDAFEVRIFRVTGGRTLVAAIELISPGNKDRPSERKAFASKCASLLRSGVALMVVDVVTERSGNLHNDIVCELELGIEPMPATFPLYASAYRPVERDGSTMLDIWTKSLAIGDPLPTLPLRIAGDYFVPIDLDASYTEACRMRKIG